MACVMGPNWTDFPMILVVVHAGTAQQRQSGTFTHSFISIIVFIIVVMKYILFRDSPHTPSPPTTAVACSQTKS